MTLPRFLRGSTFQCPKCGSQRVAYDPLVTFKGYGPGIASCQNCQTIWEAFAPEDVWDQTDPVCSFREPCNNCAFRPGSHEQSDRTRWKELISGLKDGAQFYCHKGVPIEPDAKHGFAYPSERKKMRLCRGFLNALSGIWKGKISA